MNQSEDQSEDQINQTKDLINQDDDLTMEKIMMDPLGEFYHIPENPTEPPKSDQITPPNSDQSTPPKSDQTMPPNSDQNIPPKSSSLIYKKYAFLDDVIEEIDNEEIDKSKISVFLSDSEGDQEITVKKQDQIEEDIPFELLPIIVHSERGWLTLFTDHPNSFQQGYFEHMFDTLRYCTITTYCSIVLVIHAFFPFLFQTTASDWIIYLGKLMRTKRKI